MLVSEHALCDGLRRGLRRGVRVSLTKREPSASGTDEDGRFHNKDNQCSSTRVLGCALFTVRDGVLEIRVWGSPRPTCDEWPEFLNDPSNQRADSHLISKMVCENARGTSESEIGEIFFAASRLRGGKAASKG